MATGKPRAAALRIEIIAELDVQAAEALAVEIRGLAQRHGVELKELRTERPLRPGS